MRRRALLFHSTTVGEIFREESEENLDRRALGGSSTATVIHSRTELGRSVRGPNDVNGPHACAPGR
jgi:hypothetical protein